MNLPLREGNSGGPIINEAGEVVGVASMGIKALSGSSLQWAVSFDRGMDILQSVKKYGKVLRPFIGGVVSAMSPLMRERAIANESQPRSYPKYGLRVDSVTRNMALDEAGLKPGTLP